MTPKQITLSMQHDAGFERHRKPTRRDVFLAEMDQVVPWSELCAVIAPHYPKDPEPGAGGRRTVGLDQSIKGTDEIKPIVSVAYLQSIV